MAELLYRLGRFSARRAGIVLASWLVILGIAVTGYFVAGGALSPMVDIPGTPTQKVSDRLAERLPAVSGGSGRLVFHTTDGSALTEEQRAVISALLTSTAELDGVRSTTDPFAIAQQIADRRKQVADGVRQIDAGRQLLDEGQGRLNAAKGVKLDPATQAQVDQQQALLTGKRAQLEAESAKLDRGRKLLAMSAPIRTVTADGSTAVAQVLFEKPQLDVTPEVKKGVIEHVGGNAPFGVEVEFSNEITQEVPQILGVGEVAGLVIAAITLLVMLRTLVGAALPILSALTGVGIGVTAALSLSGVVEMLSITPVLGVMLGLAVGIDYSLFILNRHRRQLLAGVDFHESIGLANGTSGNAVVFAGATVLVALLALNVTGIPFLGLMGTVGAICVAVAVLLAVTLTPALLSLIGRRVLNRRAHAQAAFDNKPMSTSRAVLTVVGLTAALVAVAIPALSMRLGLPDGSSEARESTQYQAYHLTEERFGAGVNGPILVVADLPAPLTGDAQQAEQVRIGTLLLAQNNVTAVAPIGASADNTTLAFQVIPDGGPNSSSTEQLVRDLRGLSPISGDVTFGVAGTASGNIDISEKLGTALPGYLGLVVGLSLIIMIFVFRSILVPLTATLGFILSLFATFGGVTAIFQWGWLGAIFGVHDPGPVLSFLPTILIGILFGLAMDYQLFLVSGMREAFAHGAPARVAVRQGVHAGRTVVTAAAIIMISVFGGFIFSNTAIIRSLGFGLAFGVLVDAFLVRMLLIPAIMHLLGDSAWWIPRWLDRILPDVDVEGAALERSHPVVHHAEPTAPSEEPALR
ncbi:membrane protein [Actinoplanes lobatus]|uniref:Membrane protein n=1 Tax=Actinoplanes lobatus TaxID=113568 RepID=A0A7W7MK57_9ACTN|nr:MMPL family transporter [Actinoplanes lobatus]MBB4753046.1 RND superfamily putative drug exporter [Actinoplanes lobatus]GGN87292.1 membrane protein [Actinoplanes lobatus]GIE39653.1 membrane protein [Actinoplanes lobatus]